MFPRNVLPIMDVRRVPGAGTFEFIRQLTVDQVRQIMYITAAFERKRVGHVRGFVRLFRINADDIQHLKNPPHQSIHPLTRLGGHLDIFKLPLRQFLQGFQSTFRGNVGFGGDHKRFSRQPVSDLVFFVYRADKGKEFSEALFLPSAP